MMMTQSSLCINLTRTTEKVALFKISGDREAKESMAKCFEGQQKIGGERVLSLNYLTKTQKE